MQWFILIKAATLSFAALFPVINPLGGAPIFLGLARKYPPAVQILLARKIALYGFLILVSCLMFGTNILLFFGVKIYVVQMAGGLLLAHTGWNMLHSDPGEISQATGQATQEEALGHAFYPLTFPITVGPGCVAIAITIGAHLRQQYESLSLFTLPFLSAMLGMALVCTVVAVCYSNAGRVVKWMGPTGADIVVRLSAFILLAIGVQIVWNGFSTALGLLLKTIPAPS